MLSGYISHVSESPGPRYRYASAKVEIDFPAPHNALGNGHKKYGRSRSASHVPLIGTSEGIGHVRIRASSWWPRSRSIKAAKPLWVSTTRVRPGYVCS